MSVTYTATVPARDETVARLAGLLERERLRRATRAGTRVLTCRQQAVLVVRWFWDATRMRQLATDNAISLSTGYDRLHEGIDVLAAHAPGLHAVLLAAKVAGHAHVSIDGTLIATDRCRLSGPTVGVDLWWSGKHGRHGGNIQVITAPDGWPLWTSPVRPGREHDTSALRAHNILPDLRAWTSDGHHVLGDLGYEGEATTITVATKTPKGARLTDTQRAANRAHNAVRAVGERGNALLKTTFKALRRVSLCPWRIGTIVAAALVLLHLEHNRTT